MSIQVTLYVSILIWI